MPIDRSFQQRYKIQETHLGHSVWTCETSVCGIHGTRVAVDLDICTGCMKCIAVCPVDVFIRCSLEPGGLKADPVKESDCLECLICEIVCPVDAILIARTPTTHDTLKPLLD